jgi:D-alanine transaminase
LITTNPKLQIKKAFPKEVYLNGEWINSEKAFISVFDRGFMLGDGIYEVTPFYDGNPFRLKDHLDRLQYCLNEIQIELDAGSLKKVMLEAVSRAGLSKRDCAVYIQITRGVAPRTHFFPEQIEPTVLLYAFPVSLNGFESKQASVLVSEDLRWHRCDIKSISLMANIKANNQAHSLGLDENLLVREGFFTEGTHTSIFFVKNNEIFTHPEGPHILSGITRKLILEMCCEMNISIIEKALHIDELKEVDEVFLTGTTTQILAVKSMFLNEKEIFRRNETGENTRQLQEKFIKLTRNLRSSSV